MLSSMPTFELVPCIAPAPVLYHLVLAAIDSLAEVVESLW